MWSRYCFLDFDAGTCHHAQPYIHSGKLILTPLCIYPQRQFIFIFHACLFQLAPFYSQNSTSSKYHLSAISLFANWPDMRSMFKLSLFFYCIWLTPLHTVTKPCLSTGSLIASNTSLNYLQSTLGRSYMCNAEQVLSVVPVFSLNTFKLQVQPFNVTANQFATGTSDIHFCVDDNEVKLTVLVCKPMLTYKFVSMGTEAVVSIGLMNNKIGRHFRKSE